MLTIKILAEDIRTADYIWVHDCPIVRALKRIGFEETSRAEGNYFGVNYVIMNGVTYHFDDLDYKVRQMYAGFDLENPDEYTTKSGVLTKWHVEESLPVQDFEYILQEA